MGTLQIGGSLWHSLEHPAGKRREPDRAARVAVVGLPSRASAGEEEDAGRLGCSPAQMGAMWAGHTVSVVPQTKEQLGWGPPGSPRTDLSTPAET